MRRRKFKTVERLFIAKRAGGCCEYCQILFDFSPEQFDIEHILPISLGGNNELENLALACGGCNGRKRDRTAGKDFLTNLEAPLFNPRVHIWDDHFRWAIGFLQIEGKTEIGRATVSTLELNRKGLINLRQALRLYGVHPPKK